MLLKKYKKIILLFFLIIICSCNTKSELSDITKENLEEKLHQAYLDLEERAITSTSVPVLVYIENNNITFKDPCLRIKVIHLKQAIAFFTKEYKSVTITEEDKKDLEACNNYGLRASVYNIIALNYQGSKVKPDLVINYYKRALKDAETAKNGFFIIDISQNLGIQYCRIKSFKDAIDSHNKGIKAIKEYKVNQTALHLNYISLAENYIELKEYDLAKKSLDSAQFAYNKFKSKITRKFYKDRYFRGLYEFSMQFHEKTGNMAKAFKYARLSDSMFKVEAVNSFKRVKKLSKDEIALKDELVLSNKAKIKNRNIILILSAILLLTICFFLYRTYNLSLKLKSTLKDREELNNLLKGLNSQLKENLLEIEGKNKDLSIGKAKIESLLKQNDQALFSKTLKISTYKDAVQNVMNKVRNLIDNNTKIDVSKLFFINKSLQDIISEEEIWNDFKLQFEKNRPNFFKKLLERNSDLSITEQKHCAYVAINLKSKEVANILNLSPRSVETTRYRIKKKLNLEDKSLSGFLKEL